MALLPNRVHHGDCLRKLAEIEPGTVDLVFADPPFNIGYKYDVYDDRRSRDEYLKFSRAWITAVNRALKPTGTFWLAIGDEYAAELKLMTQEAGLTCRSWVIWYYTFGVNCVRAFSRSHTHLFHFVKDPDRFTFNADNPEVRVRSARELVYADRRANSNGRLPDNTWITRPQDAADVPNAFSPMHDTWYFSRVAGTFREREGFHGCQMPEQLLGRIIRISSSPGDLVVDPFAGSGTSLAVAKKLGRQWLGIELSREYVRHVKARLDDCQVGDDLDGAADPVRSAPATSKGKTRRRYRRGRPVVQWDDDTAAGIIAAYEASCKGCATDFILCDAELNDAFIEACRRKSLPGDARTWNHLLLRIRKAGELPKATSRRRRLTSGDIDPYSAASEAAMRLLSAEFGLSLDEILCSPVAAAAFDRLAGQFVNGEGSPFEYRWAAMAIRKRAKRSKVLASQHFQHWQTEQLPPAIRLDRFSRCHDDPGVYVVMDHNGPLYVGETRDVKSRIEQLRETSLWTKYEPRSVKFIEGRGQNERYGIQSMLIGRTRPALNSPLLNPNGKQHAGHGSDE